MAKLKQFIRPKALAATRGENRSVADSVAHCRRKEWMNENEAPCALNGKGAVWGDSQINTDARGSKDLRDTR